MLLPCFVLLPNLSLTQLNVLFVVWSSNSVLIQHFYSILACCNGTSFASTTCGAVVNILAFIFSAILIDESNKIIKNHGNFAYIYLKCQLLDWTSSNIYNPNYSDFNDVFCKTGSYLAKSLLALSVLMLVSSVTYIVAYIYTLIRVLTMKNRVMVQPSAPAYPYPMVPPSNLPPRMEIPLPYPFPPEQSNMQRVQYNPGQTNTYDANVKF